MKKTYSIPETKVVVIKTMNMMAASPAVTLGSGTVGAGSIESRQDNSWDIWGTGDYDEE